MLHGAFAPSSPEICKKSNFLDEPTMEMITWYYTKPDTVSVDCYPISETASIVEVVSKSGEYLKVRTETIGRARKALIRDSYQYYFGNVIK